MTIARRLLGQWTVVLLFMGITVTYAAAAVQHEDDKMAITATSSTAGRVQVVLLACNKSPRISEMIYVMHKGKKREAGSYEFVDCSDGRVVVHLDTKWWPGYRSESAVNVNGREAPRTGVDHRGANLHHFGDYIVKRGQTPQMVIDHWIIGQKPTRATASKRA